MRISAHIKDQFYGSAAWKKLSRYKLNMCPMCECSVCREYGYELPATEVHHIIDIDVDFSKRLDYDNLMSVTHDHHSLITMTNENHSRKVKQARPQYDKDTQRLINVIQGG